MTTRLLSNITSEIGAFYGGLSYHAVEGRFRRIRAGAKLLITARERGIDPLTIELDDSKCTIFIS
jgi:hypothetical protein